MYEWNGERVLLFAPGGCEEVARLLGRCAELAAGGRAIRAGVLESPYRPGARFGLDCVESIDPDAGHAAVERREHDGGIAGPLPVRAEIPVFRTVQEVQGAMESGGRDGALCVLITLRFMNRIHEISRTDLLAVVDGGAPWSAIEAEVEGTGLYLPYSIGTSGATAAGIVMGGLSTPTDGRFGRLREHVMALEMVTGAGEIIHTGSRSVKDVSGYDLAGLVIGEGGRCGVVTRITLRLIPAPKSRVVFVANAPPGELRALARHVHRRMRPAFLELYEGRAATLLADEASGNGSALLAGEASGNGSALLIGELQAPDPGAEDRLLGEAVAGFGDGPQLVRCDPDLIRNRRRFRDLTFSELDRGSGVVHLTCETAVERLDVPDAILYRSLYPERLNCFIAREGIGQAAAAACEDPSVRPGTLLDILKSFGAERDPGLESEVVLSYRCTGSLICRRIHRDVFEQPVSTALTGGSLERSPEQRDAFDTLWERVRNVFDPRKIMLP